jgi:hypothetical protein
MGMRAAQIHKAGALELRPAIKDPKTEADEEGRDRIGGRFFHVRSNSKAETAPARRLGVRVPEPSPCAPYPSAESTLSGKIRAGPVYFVIPGTLAG